jgi:ferric-dicitrate binding protein FerR (iron transport regulator)
MLAVAATAACVCVGLTIGSIAYQDAGRAIALVSAVQGEVEVSRERHVEAASAKTPVIAESQISTEHGRAALSLGALSLRMDERTQITLHDDAHVTLHTGRLYVDSGGLGIASALRIETPAGTLRHLGTQFQIALDRGQTQVMVREGRVSLTRAGSRNDVLVSAGQRLRADAQGTAISPAARHGNEWSWVNTLTNALDIENRPLSEFVAWIAREHGWQVRYVSPQDERLAQTVRLHGSLESLTPVQMIERVSLITGIALEAQDGALIVGGENAADTRI